MTRRIALALFLAALLTSHAFAQTPAQTKPKITFLELGSVGCIPCKKMVPIMRSIETRYGDQVKVIFHDVRKEKEKAEQYKVNIIPTQVFLDAEGKEIHRHVGYYPEADIDKLLKKHGLKPRS
jgi:thioredoxin 1